MNQTPDLDEVCCICHSGKIAFKRRKVLYTRGLEGVSLDIGSVY
jgi:hypothetical protein